MPDPVPPPPQHKWKGGLQPWEAASGRRAQPDQLHPPAGPVAPLPAPPLLNCKVFGGTWLAQSVKHPTSAQVMMSGLEGSSLASGSVLTAQSLEPASDSVSPPLSSPPLHSHSVSLSFKNKH